MSPCINKCRLVDGVCANCHRTKEEVINWIRYSKKEKQEILNRIEEQKNNTLVK